MKRSPTPSFALCRPMRWTVLVLVLSLVAPWATAARADTWIIECVDCPKYFRDMSDRSLRLDGADRPHVAYGGDQLFYAWHNGSGWLYETVDQTPGAGTHAALALDTSGYPHISYYWGSPDYDLRYVYKDASGWHTEVADDWWVGKHTSLALDGDGYPHISYASDGGNLRYAYKDTSGWSLETVDSQGQLGVDNSLALDSQGYPHISYFDGAPNYNLKYAHQDAAGWQVATVDETSMSGSDSLLVIGIGDHAHISYMDEWYGDLRYASHDDSGWHLETVLSDATGYLSLALDGDNYPHIAYVAGTSHDLVVRTSGCNRLAHRDHSPRPGQ